MSLVVVVPTINNLKYLKKMIESLPHRGEAVVVIDQASTDDTPQWLAEHPGIITLTQEKNIGVAPSWNLGILSAFHMGATHVAVLNNDIILHPNALDRLVAWEGLGCWVPTVKPVTMIPADPMPWDQVPLNRWVTRPGDFCGFLVTKKVIDIVGWFDEKFELAYCVTPETPVLTEDLRWRPIGEVRVGDWLIGVDEMATQAGRRKSRRRSYRKSQVLSIQKRLTRCLRIVMADGREVVCSRDHKWLAKYSAGIERPYHWRPASRLRVGYRIATPLDVWKSAGTWEEGWLAAICDGEGDLVVNEATCRVGISQSEGVVLDQILAMLDQFSLPYRMFRRSWDNVCYVTVGVRRHALRLLGQTRPVRFLQKLQMDGLPAFVRDISAAHPIVEISDAGEREVVSIETTTKTYLANGMVAHNCEDLDYEMRLMRSGIPHGMAHDALVYHFGSRSVVEGGVDTGLQFSKNAAYFERKWGMHHEAARRMIARAGPPILR